MYVFSSVLKSRTVSPRRHPKVTSATLVKTRRGPNVLQSLNPQTLFDQVFREDINERCPVFSLNSKYLIKLAQHTYSNMFGMFLCNNSRERAERNIANRTFSVWNILQAPQFVNHLYYPQEQVLWPSCNIRDLELWREL
ncbi:Myotubularin- protein 4 [Homalodisca vitripennis]|nr:Myotubularin- protein 4 [Homalodisca vitripennis]